MKATYLKVTITLYVVNFTERKRVVCGTYSGVNKQTFGTTGGPHFLAVDNGIAYYTETSPNR